ncbi:MAG: hypothetical protein ISS82_06165 [Nanoarchaeota archaeon]|nr:hypothetical protein [Nanoarchaeota archaeon]
MQYARTPSIRELTRGTFSVSGSSAAQLYSVPGFQMGSPPPLITDPLAPSFDVMRSTEVSRYGLDRVHPGLGIIDKYHPPGLGYPDPSFEEIAGIRGEPGSTASLIPKKPI